MKKVGILTFHFANNYGAVLQAYALRKAINQLPDCEAEIINYVPKGYRCIPFDEREESLHLLEGKRNKMENFLTRECGICTPMLSEVSGNEYDYYCVGSDQVWNTDMFGGQNEEYFFPHLDNDAVRISYAASIGTEADRINETIFCKYLPKFQAISLREYNYISYLNKLCNVSCESVLDPTLLLESSVYESLADKNIRMSEPYILLLWYNMPGENTRYVEFVNKLSRKYDLPVVHSIINAPRYMFYKDGGCMMYEGIEGFLWYMKNAEFVVTNSFHGSIFAVQFQRPFYIFISKLRRSRLDCLVNTLGIKERVVDRYIDFREINKKIDFSLIKEKVVENREKSFQFLKKALEIEG